MQKDLSQLDLAKRIFFEENARYPRYRINYFIPHFRADAEVASMFMAYWPGVLFSIDLLELSLILPFDIREIKSKRSPLAISRVCHITAPSIIPITMESLEESTEWLDESVYNCILSNNRTFERVSKFVQDKGGDWLHISTSDHAEKNLRNISWERFEGYVIQRTGQMLEQGKINSIFTDSVQDVINPQRPPWSRLQFPAYAHGVTRANELIACSLGAEIFLDRALRPDRPEEYVAAVIKSCKAVASIRRKFAGRAPTETDICLTTEPIIWNLYKADIDKELFSRLNESEEVIRALRRFVKSIKRPGGYTKIGFVESFKKLEKLMENESAALFLRFYRMELEAFTTSLAILNAPSLTPVLRLESRVNGVKGDLINLAACARGNNPHLNFKMCKLAIRAQEKMESFVAPAQINFLNGTLEEFSGVTLFGDLPLEWLPLRGLPLALRCDVSRVPATPGNLSLHQSLRSQYVNIDESAFEEILIVRSFDADDRIRSTLENALDQLAAVHNKYPRYKFIDVNTVDQFIEVVNGFNGAVMIFDGHGTVRKDQSVGTIIIGGIPIDVWGLREVIQVPPIVLLSACDTLPIDGGHGSVANGMLALGAVTVLGTVLPVDSRKSAIFIGRLLHRIAEFLPIVVSRSSYMPWRSFMSGMLRMTFCSELIISLIEDAKIISISDYPGIQMAANMGINSLQPDWYEGVIDSICSASQLNRDVVVEKCRFWGAMVDSLKYIQIGRPEKIRLRSMSVDKAIEILVRDKGISVDSIPTIPRPPSMFFY